MDKSIDDQLIREASEDGASRERLRIMLASGAMGALANVLCRIDGLLPPRGETHED